jgi:thioredoxin reductase
MSAKNVNVSTRGYSMTTDQPIDVAIIGGGPAGYAAAIYAARANLTTTVIEQGMSGGQIATTNEVENYPGIPLLSGAELGERFQQHAEGLGAQVEWSMVTGIDYDADSALFSRDHVTHNDDGTVTFTVWMPSSQKTYRGVADMAAGSVSFSE